MGIARTVTMIASPPRATYRLQLNRDFTFRDATALVDYLADLGVSHVYASPFLQARRGSTHGYDITDHNRLNPEIGTEADFAALVARLHGRGLGLILDFVPNHMGIGSDNAWWLEVLEWGEASPTAAYFDIDWNGARQDMRGKVLLPVLGDQYGTILENGEIALRFDRTTGSFLVAYYDHRFPVSPLDYAELLSLASDDELDPAAETALRDLTAAANRIAGDRSVAGRARTLAPAAELKRQLRDAAAAYPQLAAAFDAAAASVSERGAAGDWHALHDILEAQSYRLAYWRVASDEINYRRFFNINDLAGLRIEQQELFDAAHRLIFELLRDGSLQGLRIDHIDGLFDPKAYCRQLQERAAGLGVAPLYVVVEKILARYENLPDWPIAGTTGYEFTNQVLGLFIDPKSERRLTRLYVRASGRTDEFDAVLYASKMRICTVNLASEVNVLARRFHELALFDWRRRDYTLNGMVDALREVLTAFPVYRTYVDAAGASAEDRRYIDWAIAIAKRRSPAIDTSIFDFIHAMLTGELNGRYAERTEDVRRLAMRFQQVSGPVMAKGLEDTAFYRYFRLAALNEVGGDPRRIGLSAAAFHRLNEDRVKHWPHAMLTTSTHDTKRGEDARARLALLSELPAEWRRRVGLWYRLNRRWRGKADEGPAPSGNDEYLFYQGVVGAWPLDLDPADAAGVRGLAERIGAFMLKAVREGKEQSSWGNPHAEYEALLARFIENALDASRPNAFVVDLAAFVMRLARLGAINGLAQVVLKLTSPGVPDIYQGCELWDFNLVDPDNRRPVDYALRKKILADLRARIDHSDGGIDPAGRETSWAGGGEKLFLTWRVLQCRAARPETFAGGGYVALAASGAKADHLLGFARQHGEDCVVVAVPRLVASIYDDTGAADWGDTGFDLPAGRVWRNVFSGKRIVGVDRIAASDLFADFPVTVLTAESSGGLQP
jgi:(1->4)-alpha-D-glucan 1-alpha-D-glucosylmutase